MPTCPGVRGRTGSLARVRVLVTSSTRPSMPSPPASGNVTVLAADADSFSGDKRLTRAQSGPARDVACPVAVGILLAAVRADDDFLLWSGAACATRVAVEAGVAGVNADHSPSSAFSLGDEDSGESSPAGIQDRPVEPGLLCDIPPRFLNGAPSRGGQTADVKVLQRQHVIGVNQRPGRLVVEVAALVADLAPLLGERSPEPLAISRAGPVPCCVADGQSVLARWRGTSGCRRRHRRWW